MKTTILHHNSIILLIFSGPRFGLTLDDNLVVVCFDVRHHALKIDLRDHEHHNDIVITFFIRFS